jgi:outer membrane protein OmpA-like peptidoglycan-associated protein
MNDKSVYQHMNEAVSNLQDDTEAMKHNFLLKGFFKNRGYEDTSEIKRNLIARLPAAAPDNRFSWPGAKLFDKPDSAKLKNPKMLDDAGKSLEGHPYGLAVVADFADNKGDTDKQRQLSEARAAVVREYLVQHYKLDDTKLKVIGLGKSPNVPDGGNVELRVYAK